MRHPPMADYRTTDRSDPDYERDDDRPGGVSENRTIVAKVIDQRRYYYWRWHEQECIEFVSGFVAALGPEIALTSISVK